MRIIKSNQNGVFSEYLKIMSKFNEKRSIKKTASALSGIAKVTVEVAEMSAEALSKISKTADEVAILLAKGGDGLDELIVTVKAADPGAGSRALKELLGQANYQKVVQETISGASDGIVKNVKGTQKMADDLIDLSMQPSAEKFVDFAKKHTDVDGLTEAQKINKQMTVAGVAAVGQGVEATAPRNKILVEALNSAQDANAQVKLLDELAELSSDGRKLTPDEIKGLDGFNPKEGFKYGDEAIEGAGDATKTTQNTSETAAKQTDTVKQTDNLDSDIDSRSLDEAADSSGFEKNFGGDPNEAMNKLVTDPDGNGINDVISDVSTESQNLTSSARSLENITDAGKAEGEITELVKSFEKIKNQIESLKGNLGNVEGNLGARISDAQTSLEDAIKNASDSLTQGQVDSLEKIMVQLDAQPGHVKAAMLGEMEEMKTLLKEGGGVSEARIQKLEETLTTKIDELPSVKQLEEMLDKKFGPFEKSMEAKIEGVLKKLMDADPNAKGIIGKILGETGAKSSWWKTALKITAVTGAVALIGYAAFNYLNPLVSKPTTPLPPQQQLSMMTPAQIQPIVGNADNARHADYLQATITCLSVTEMYIPGSTSEKMAQDCLAAATDALAKYNTLKATLTPVALADFSAANDKYIREMAKFGLHPDRSNELQGPYDPNKIRDCLGWQITSTRIANDVSTDIGALRKANTALQMAQQQMAGGAGAVPPGQGTTLNPGGFQNVQMQNANNLYPIFGRDVMINMNGVQLQFSLAQFNMVPRRNLAGAAVDYRSLLTSGRVLNELEKSLNSTGKEFIADPDRYKVEGYMYDAPAFRNMPSNVRTLKDVEDIALGGGPVAQAAYNVLGYAIARHIRNTLEAGGLSQYTGGFSRGKGKRRDQMRAPGFGYHGDRVQDMRRANQEKNKIIKESINNNGNSDLNKFSDDFSKGYYKDAVKDLSSDDSFLKEFYKSYGELSEYKPEAKKTESLYGLNEKDDDLVLNAHPQTANMADSRGKGGLVENGHEQHKRMQEMFGDMPTANFKGSYAKLKEQMKKHGY
jgi:hypothetical protein